MTRYACRKVLDELRPGHTITMCLPLFLVGDQKQRTFTGRIATITLDGCAKQCSTITAARIGGRSVHSLVVSEILERNGARLSGDAQSLGEGDQRIVDLVAEEIACQVDRIIYPSR